MIKHSFFKCGLSNNLKDTEDDQIKIRGKRMKQCLPHRGSLLSSSMTRIMEMRVSLQRLILITLII